MEAHWRSGQQWHVPGRCLVIYPSLSLLLCFAFFSPSHVSGLWQLPPCALVMLTLEGLRSWCCCCLCVGWLWYESLWEMLGSSMVQPSGIVGHNAVGAAWKGGILFLDSLLKSGGIMILILCLIQDHCCSEDVSLLFSLFNNCLKMLSKHYGVLKGRRCLKSNKSTSRNAGLFPSELKSECPV